MLDPDGDRRSGCGGGGERTAEGEEDDERLLEELAITEETLVSPREVLLVLLVETEECSFVEEVIAPLVVDVASAVEVLDELGPEDDPEILGEEPRRDVDVLIDDASPAAIRASDDTVEGSSEKKSVGNRSEDPVQ